MYLFCLRSRVSDVRAGSLAAIFCFVYNLSHYKKSNFRQIAERASPSNQRGLPSNQLAPVTAAANTMPSRYSNNNYIRDGNWFEKT